MKRKLLQIFAFGLCFLLVFSSVGPVYANAQSTKDTSYTNLRVHTSVNNTNVVQSSNVAKQSKNIEVQPYGIKTKVVSFALRNGGSALGNLIKKIPYKWADKAGDSIGKWGNTAANVVDELNEFGETTVVAALVGAGIPPADAAVIAKFIVFFLG